MSTETRLKSDYVPATEVLVIPHIPKTGGQTLRHIFNEQLTHNSDFIHLGPWGNKLSTEAGLAPWQQRQADERGKARVIFGHFVRKNEIEALLPNHTLNYATCLRQPADRWISEYNFKIAAGTIDRDTDFWSFFNAFENPNEQVTFLYHHYLQRPVTNIELMAEIALSELSRFTYVGLLDHYREYMEWICQFLDIAPDPVKKNVTGIDFDCVRTLSREEKQKINERCQYDMLLYDHVAATRKKIT